MKPVKGWATLSPFKKLAFPLIVFKDQLQSNQVPVTVLPDETWERMADRIRNDSHSICCAKLLEPENECTCGLDDLLAELEVDHE